MANVIFKVGTKALFDALEQKDTNTLYWLEDVQELYKGNLLFATGKAASQTAAGLMSAEDKVKLDNLSAGTVAGLTPVDATIVIADGEEGTKTRAILSRLRMTVSMLPRTTLSTPLRNWVMLLKGIPLHTA